MSVIAGDRDVCPHCRVGVLFERVEFQGNGHQVNNLNVRYPDKSRQIRVCGCPACGEIILFYHDTMMWPRGAVRPSAPKEVPTSIAEDYNEACLVEPSSKKAAAALARRCLQNMFHDQGIMATDLNKEIDAALPSLPGYIGENVDAIRTVGNFSAHPLKSNDTGQIVEVEEGETEWVLETLLQLFDHYYVKPAQAVLRRQAMNKKLAETGKPPLK